MLGATNTFIMGFSFIFAYAISKTRTGAAVAIQQILGNFSWKILLLIILVMLISGIVSFLLVKILAKFFSQKIEKMNYSLLSIIILIILIIVVFLVSSFLGVLLLAISTLTGIYCISTNVKRTQMMGCLLLPTILLYLL